ncbi:methyltransferase domain-containing protein [Ophiocordyceps camponoti-floridani]|uniref:Methyltransferase domain-containing protein n=1 Tax=Ophiocordyceps camponoti-floridani TaxID=2030778 RepID=A0A8H4Q8E3_9HYPO|nr:methyltransferase domain-containing protein [Ophiocordyceps camponoti-floridani]
MEPSQENATTMGGQEKWFDRAPPKLTTGMRAVFEKYSGMSPDDVQKRAFKLIPYPCVGRYYFLELGLPRSPFYEDIKQRLIHGEKLLDLGCGFGQELRKLALDDVPTRNLYGCDLNVEFTQLGYEVFLDKGKNQMTFLEADILNPESELRLLDGQISFINAQLFFHLFTRSQQIQIAVRLIALLDPAKDCLIVGRHLGSSKVAEYDLPGEVFTHVHTQDSWKSLWDEVGRLTGTLWDVEIVQESAEDLVQTIVGPGAYWMSFTIRKLSP